MSVDRLNRYLPRQLWLGTVRLTPRLLLVGAVCYFSTEIGFAHKVPPHNISYLWPTNAILFSVLVITPARHWWAYSIAAYFTSIIRDALAGFPIAGALFLAAALIEAFVAAYGVRKFANGDRAFESFQTFSAYIIVAVVIAPVLSSFVAAFASGAQDYWYFWRIWFPAQSLAYLTLAPAILTCVNILRKPQSIVAPTLVAEACLLGSGLIAVCITVFALVPQSPGSTPTLIYLPLPFLLWAAIRLGPLGASASLLIMTMVAISSTVHGNGPFATSDPNDGVLPLQLFLYVVSLPLMFLAALITERREKTNVLRESESRFRSLADSAPVLIWISDTHTARTFFNKTWLKFRGRTLEDECGTAWTGGVHADDINPYFAAYTTALEGRHEFIAEYRLRRSDGEFRWVHDKGVPRYAANGAFLGYIGCAEDITDRRRMEEEAALQRQEVAHLMRASVLGQLSGAIAHEINQPLGAILANAQAALELLPQGSSNLVQLHEVLVDIAEDGRRASKVVQRLRSLLEKGERVFEPIDMNDLVSSTIALVQGELAARKVKIAVDLASAPTITLGDPIQLQQVLLNLIINGMDAVVSRPVFERQLTVSTFATDSGSVEIRVKDRGSGIDRAERERVFEPFYTTKKHGLGLGLPISLTIVRSHGGKLVLVNNDDGGAVAVVSIPAHRSQIAA